MWFMNLITVQKCYPIHEKWHIVVFIHVVIGETDVRRSEMVLNERKTSAH